ncbi:MAG: hypothetical protein RBU37_16805 [Myxococcota bacterium]|nr:hypothetical protein [Myxococcota bacterium]
MATKKWGEQAKRPIDKKAEASQGRCADGLLALASLRAVLRTWRTGQAPNRQETPTSGPQRTLLGRAENKVKDR